MKRELYLYKNYFEDFYKKQSLKVRKKIVWTLGLVESLPWLPDTYLKKLENTEGIYEIRVQSGNNIFRIFCFFDSNNLIVIGHGFQKKTQKTPIQEIEKAKQIKKEYYEEKEFNKP